MDFWTMTEELLFLSCHDIVLDFVLYLDFLKKLEKGI